MCVRECVENTENPKEKPEKCVWCGCVLCGVVRWEILKKPETMGKLLKTRTPFWARYGQLWTKKRPKTDFSPLSRHIVLTLSLRFTDVFGRRVPFQTAKNAFLGLRSQSRGPNHGLEKGPDQRNTL